MVFANGCLPRVEVGHYWMGMRARLSPDATRRLTLSDIANAVGVSRITVSRALRNSDLVRLEVRQQIQQVAAAMGYRPNLAARDLRLRQRNRIAVVVDMTASADRPMYDPYPLAILGGIMQQCATAGLALLLTTSGNAISPETLDSDGIILLGQGSNHHAVHALAAFGLPLAVWGADDGVESRLGVSVVGSDNRSGGRLAASHMLAHGRRRLVFLGNPSHAEVSARLSGCRQRLDECDAMLVAERPCDFTAESGREVTAALLAEGVRPDGVFAGSDLMAIGAMQALREAGFAPGRDVSIVGYDDSPAAASHSPGLTSVHQDWTAGGELLAATLLHKLDPDRYAAPASSTLASTLIVRDT